MGDSPAETDLGRDAAVALRLPRAFRYLSLVRETALEVAEEQGFDLFQAGQIEMAVDEACTNAIEHSYGGECTLDQEDGDPGLVVRFLRAPSGITIEITDFGAGFDYHADRVIDPEEYITNRNERGLGLYIISRFVDQVHYERGGTSGNTMRLTKSL